MDDFVKQLRVHYGLVGNSAVMAELAKLIGRLAPTNCTVLVQGESGTGKELVARAIHGNSSRSAGPFVAVDCASLSEQLLESELFGYERGAFTGAVAAKTGEFEIADGGTLFLDEVGEMPPRVQSKLLRVLQQREIKRIGSTRWIPVDIRLISATNRDLAGNDFRPELYHRLNVVSLRIAPLRDRLDDVPILARHFVEKYSTQIGRDVRGISPEAEAVLVGYSWPGNVRELENAIESAVALGSTDMVLSADLPGHLFNERVTLLTYEQSVSASKRQIIERALAQNHGDYKQAAASLGLYPTSLHRLMRNLGLKR